MRADSALNELLSSGPVSGIYFYFDQQREEIQKKITEVPSKRRSENRPSQGRTDARDTRETIGLYTQY